MFTLISLSTLIGFIVKATTALSKRTPKTDTEILSETVFDILNKYLPDGIEPKMTDSEYKAYDTSEVDKIVELFVKQGHKYSVDYDCDNFAFSLYSFLETALPRCMFGVEMVNNGKGYHALNVYVDKDMNKWYVEPQMGERTSAETSKYKPDWSLM